MAQRAKSKKRPLRPPFLVTIATLAGTTVAEAISDLSSQVANNTTL